MPDAWRGGLALMKLELHQVRGRSQIDFGKRIEILIPLTEQHQYDRLDLHGRGSLQSL